MQRRVPAGTGVGQPPGPQPHLQQVGIGHQPLPGPVQPQRVAVPVQPGVDLPGRRSGRFAARTSARWNASWVRSNPTGTSGPLCSQSQAMSSPSCRPRFHGTQSPCQWPNSTATSPCRRARSATAADARSPTVSAAPDPRRQRLDHRHRLPGPGELGEQARGAGVPAVPARPATSRSAAASAVTSARVASFQPIFAYPRVRPGRRTVAASACGSDPADAPRRPRAPVCRVRHDPRGEQHLRRIEPDRHRHGQHRKGRPVHRAGAASPGAERCTTAAPPPRPGGDPTAAGSGPGPPTAPPRTGPRRCARPVARRPRSPRSGRRRRPPG